MSFSDVSYRYPIGKLKLPYFTVWVKKNLGADLSTKTESCPLPSNDSFPSPQVSKEFLGELTNGGISYSLEGDDRQFRSHGHTLHEIYNIRTGNFPRIPDVVAWPEKHDQVVYLVNLAMKRK